MVKSDIRKVVYKVISDTFDFSLEQITDATSAADIPEWDSLNNIRVLICIEDELGIRLPLGRIFDAKNVGQMIDVIDDMDGTKILNSSGS